MRENEYKRILILNPTHIGNTLCNVPLFMRVKRRYPNANVTIAMAKRNGVLAPYLRGLGFECIAFDNNFTGFDRYKTIFRYGWKCYKSFDYGICSVEPRKTDHILLHLLCKRSRAYVQNNWHGKLISEPVAFYESELRSLHHSQFLCNVFDRSPVSKNEWPRVKITADGAFDIPLENKQDKRVPVLYISARNNRKTSLLNKDKQINVIRQAYERCKFFTIINDYQFSTEAKELQDGLGVPCSVVITPDFQQLLKLIAFVDCCLVGDGGVSHVAAWLNTPELVLFGETSLIEWTPLGENVSVLYDPRDVNNIPDEVIVESLIKLIDSSQSENEN